MVTPEQLKSRRADNELRNLRQENERLQDNLSEIRKGFARFVRAIAPLAPLSQRLTLLHQARELEDAPTP